MAFLVEDGTGLTLANSYLSVADYTTHHVDRGRTVSASSSIVQGALIRATDYIDKRFGRSFRGYRELKAQGLEWPRIGAQDNDGWLLEDVPLLLQKATAEYARVAINIGVIAPPAPTVSVPESIAEVAGTQALGEVVREKVDVIDTQYQPISDGRPTAEFGSLPEIPEADLWMSELIVGLNRLLERG